MYKNIKCTKNCPKTSNGLSPVLNFLLFLSSTEVHKDCQNSCNQWLQLQADLSWTIR